MLFVNSARGKSLKVCKVGCQGLIISYSCFYPGGHLFRNTDLHHPDHSAWRAVSLYPKVLSPYVTRVEAAGQCQP